MKTTKQLVKFDFDVAVITALDAKYKDIQITDTTSYAIVMAGLAEYRELRLAIDDKHKELKSDILEAGRGLDGDKNRLKSLLEPGENHLKEIRQTEDDRKAKIKEEKEAKERERIEAIQEKINRIRAQGIGGHNVPSSLIQERIIITQGMPVGKDVFMEFTEQAEEARKEAIAILEQALADQLEYEKAEAERKAEIAHLEVQRKEQAEAQAKIDEENRKIDLAKAELEEKEAAEVRRTERAEFERQATIKAEQEAKEKGAREEQEKIDKEKAEEEDKARIEALKPDRQKLIAFANDILEVHIPELKSTQAIQVLHEGQSRLYELAREIKKQAKEL